MTAATGAAPLVDRQGWAGGIDAVVVACVWAGRRLAVADGDGRVSWIDPAQPRIEARPAHAGAVLAAAATPDGRALITGGDDGCLFRHTADGGAANGGAANGEAAELARFPGRWIEHLALSPTLGLGVAAAGKEAIVFDPLRGATLRRFAQPNSIGGLALDPKGRRVAISHYGAVTLSWIALADGNPRRLEWKGSHLAVTWSPNGRFVITAMQEQMLHGWRLDGDADMRMSGYATKTRAFSWSAKGRWLATSGASQAVCWPFTGSDGPMGKIPLQRGEHGLTANTGSDGGEPGPLVTQVAFHPKEDVLAAGYDDGCVELIRLADGTCIPAVAPAADPVTSIAWSHDGSILACGSESGRIALIRITAETRQR